MAIPNWLKNISFYYDLALKIFPIGILIWGGIEIRNEGAIFELFLKGDRTLPGYLITIFSFLFAITLVLLISKSFKIRRNQILIPIRTPASLGLWTFEGISFEALRPFNLDPGANSSMSVFVNDIYISDNYACAYEPEKGGCNAEIITLEVGMVDYKICSRSIDHFRMEKDNDFYVFKNRAEGIIRGEIRNNFNKYKKIYKNELDKITKGRYSKYDVSWNKYRVSGGAKHWQE